MLTHFWPLFRFYTPSKYDRYYNPFSDINSPFNFGQKWVNTNIFFIIAVIVQRKMGNKTPTTKNMPTLDLKLS